jgi:serine/threonine-protein kinase
MDMAVGETFARYRITGILGRGGMSVVYSAEHLQLGRTVALKVLSQALARDETFRERFTRESQLAASLDHPSIIPIYDAGEYEGLLYIAMRYVEGCDLGTLIEQEGPLSLGQTLFYVEQVASALDQAHEQGLIHRDVKPANVLIARPSDRAFLTDFGIVKQMSTHGLTKPAYFLGTYEYSAPEQIEGKQVDRRTDVYALGCILYECLSAEPPFKGDTEGALIRQHLTEAPPRLATRRPDIPVAVTDVVATAMAKRKEDRYPTCGDFTRQLRAVALGTTTAGPSPAPARATVHAGAAGTPPEQGAPTSPAPGAETSLAPAAGTSLAPAATSLAQGPGSSLAQEAGTPPVEGAGTSVAPATSLAQGDGGEPPGQGPPSDAAAPEPEGTSGPRTIAVTGRRIAAFAAALALLVVGIPLAILALGDDDEKSAGGTGTSTTISRAAASGLAGIVPHDVFKRCKAAPTRAGAQETVTCSSDALTFFPDVELSFYKSTPALQAAYDGLRQKEGIAKDFGRCDGVAWNGEGEWKHDTGKTGGRRFCVFQNNQAVIYWSHERLGQPSHRDMLGIARANELSNDDLTNWYNFWRDRIGKCPQKDCTARF